MLYLGIRREDRFSPNRISNDKAIFEAVCSELASPDDMLFKMKEDEFASDGAGDTSMYDAVFHMCRSDRALARLAEIEQTGIPVINRTDAVLNCRRPAEVRLLQGAGTAFVRSCVVTDGRLPDEWDEFPCWIKRGESHALESDDVLFASSRSEAEKIMTRISGKGKDEIVIQSHMPGKIVKFYGVSGGRLFHYRFLESVSEGKFGLEVHNEMGTAPMDEERFRSETAEIARILGIDAYGGDAIVAPDGKITIVDFNDWPSFFACRGEAAEAIAGLVREKCGK